MVFAALVAAVLVALARAQNDIAPAAAACGAFPSLPPTLNLASSLGGGSNALHIHDQFRAQLGASSQSISFTVTVPSVVRFNVAPNAVDVDLWLFAAGSARYIALSSLGINDEAALITKLQPGSYRLDFFYFRWGAGGSGQQPLPGADVEQLCSLLVFEAAILPLDTFRARLQSHVCPARASYPVIDTSALQASKPLIFDSLRGGLLDYDSMAGRWTDIPILPTPPSPYSMFVPTPSGGTFTAVFVKLFDAIVPPTTYAWEMEMSIAYNFLFDDSLLLVLVPFGSNATRDCISVGDCVVGSNARMNEHVLRQLLPPGMGFSMYLMDDPLLRVANTSSNATLSCSDFSVFLTIVPTDFDETFANCDAMPLPESLNTLPGLMDGTGRMHIRTKVLDTYVSWGGGGYARSQGAALMLQQRSIVALANYDGSYDNVYNSTNGYSGVMLLDPGMYTYSHSGKWVTASMSCSSSQIDMAVYPLADSTVVSPATGQTPFEALCGTGSGPSFVPFPSSLPDISPLSTVVAFGQPGRYDLSAGSAPTDGNGNVVQAPAASTPIWGPLVVLDQQFNVTFPTAVRLYLWYDPAIGPMNLLIDRGYSLYTSNTKTSYYGGLAFVGTVLQPGSHQLTITATLPSFWSGNDVLGALPPCYRYRLEAEVTPAPIAASSKCTNAPALPTTLMSPGLLGPARTAMHYQADVLIPKVTFFSTSVDVTFALQVPSLFRAYIAPNAIDIDMSLYNGTQLLQPTASGAANKAEQLVFSLLPGTSYRLRFTFYASISSGSGSSSTGTPCPTFNLEMAIAPLSDAALLGAPCRSGGLPPPNGALVSSAFSRLGPNFNSSFVTGSFSFVQNASAQTFLFDLPLTTLSPNAPVILRAVVSYSFAWNDLAVRLRYASNANPSAYIAIGTDGYNTNVLSTPPLQPNSYVIEVYQSAALPGDVRAAQPMCGTFTIQVGMDQVFPPDSNELTILCDSGLMPGTLSAPAYLSDLNAYTTHFVRDVPVVSSDVASGKDSATSLFLQQQSLVHISSGRIMASDFGSSDLSPLPVSITYFDPAQRWSTYITSWVPTGYTSVLLPPGAYLIVVNRWMLAFESQPLDACESIPLEISVTPFVDAATSLSPLVSTACTTSLPPAVLPFGVSTLAAPVRYSFAGTDDSTWLGTFVADDNGVSLALYVYYVQPATFLSLTLSGLINDVYGPVVVTYPVSVSGNTQFVDVGYLPPGTYNVTIGAPALTAVYNASIPSAVSVGCTAFDLAFVLNTSAPGSRNPMSTCQFTDVLPSDLWSPSGGSLPFGGPQNAVDGSVRIYGENFLLPIFGQYHIKHTMTFKVVTPSVLRVFITQVNVDIDVYLYVDATQADLLGAARASINSAYDTFVARVDPAISPNPVLVIEFYSRPADQSCLSFLFEFDMQPVPVVQELLSCPTVMPAQDMPPNQIAFSGGVARYGGAYILTSDRYKAEALYQQYYWSWWERSFVLTVAGAPGTPVATPFLVDASVDFDFLAGSFGMSVNSPNGIYSYTTWDSSMDRASIFLTFRKALRSRPFTLAGNYTFEVYFSDDSDDQPDAVAITEGMPSWCRRFLLSIVVFDTTTAPFVLSVDPLQVLAVDPSQALVLTVRFSEDVGNWQSAVARQLVQLVDTASGAVVSLTTATWGVGGTSVLYATFAPYSLASGRTYKAVVQSTLLTTAASSKPFAAYDGSINTYTTVDCGCSSHGSCPSGSVRCQCDDGYTGPNCEGCASGFAAQGTLCTPEQVCFSSTCAHGTCASVAGVAQCSCHDGWTGPTCDTPVPKPPHHGGSGLGTALLWLLAITVICGCGVGGAFVYWKVVRGADVAEMQASLWDAFRRAVGGDAPARGVRKYGELVQHDDADDESLVSERSDRILNQKLPTDALAAALFASEAGESSDASDGRRIN